MPDPEPTLAALFQTHRDGLAGAVRAVLGAGADVPEVLQDAFLRCWQAARRGASPADPVAWVFVVTWNVAVDARRKRQRRPAAVPLDEANPMHLQTHHAPFLAVERRDEVALAEAAIQALGDDEKQVFLLRTSGELTFEAVGAALGIPIGTAKTRMRSALHKLRQALAAGPDDRGQSIARRQA